MKVWKIHCMEDKFPGMWQRWYRNQCVAVGWPDASGYPLHGKITAKLERRAWERARSALKKMGEGDYVVVALKGNRIGRMGEVTKKEINEWKPLVPKSRDHPYGEIGRRIFVRWELTTGPIDRDTIVCLPDAYRFTRGELRTTIAEVKSQSLDDLREAMNDSNNWKNLLAHFDYENALSGYIATYPHHLEDGLTLHPTLRSRELTFKDKTRADVILLDRDGYTVAVECKQEQPTVADVHQLRRYMGNLKREHAKVARGILVHGGTTKVHKHVADLAAKSPQIEVVAHRLTVNFFKCS